MIKVLLVFSFVFMAILPKGWCPVDDNGVPERRRDNKEPPKYGISKYLTKGASIGYISRNDSRTYYTSNNDSSDYKKQLDELKKEIEEIKQALEEEKWICSAFCINKAAFSDDTLSIAMGDGNSKDEAIKNISCNGMRQSKTTTFTVEAEDYVGEVKLDFTDKSKTAATCVKISAKPSTINRFKRRTRHDYGR